MKLFGRSERVGREGANATTAHGAAAPQPPSADIELRLEDGVVIARKVLNPAKIPTLIPGDSSIVRKWRDMDEKAKADFARAVTGIEPGTRPEYSILSRTPLNVPTDASELILSIEARSRDVLAFEAIRKIFPHADSVSICHQDCDDMAKGARAGKDSHFSVLGTTTMSRTAHNHVHAKVMDANGSSVVPFYVYGLQQYLTQRDAPAEIVDVLHKANARAYEVASPEWIQEIATNQRIRDPLLFALIGNVRYVIWQWE